MSAPAAESLPRDLREFADALDKDRGHSKSAVTGLMRDAADEIERLRHLRASSPLFGEVR